MKETKKVAKKKTTTKSNRESKPKVKEIKIEDNFFDDEEDHDKRLIVFIVIAILVILATIVTLVIGCDKKKEQEPVNPNDDIVIPDKKDDKEDEDEGVDTKEIVRKVSAVYKGTSKKTKKKKTTNEVVKYDVTYYLGDKFETIQIEKGKEYEEFVPKGYDTCQYYKDAELTEEFDITATVKGEINIYMDCGDPIVYTVTYVPDNGVNNPTTYTVEDPEATLVGTGDANFEGWYLTEDYTIPSSPLAALVPDVVDYANGTTITLYAKFGETTPEPGCVGDDCPVPGTDGGQGAEDPSQMTGMSLNTFSLMGVAPMEIEPCLEEECELEQEYKEVVVPGEELTIEETPELTETEEVPEVIVKEEIVEVVLPQEEVIEEDKETPTEEVVPETPAVETPPVVEYKEPETTEPETTITTEKEEKITPEVHEEEPEKKEVKEEIEKVVEVKEKKENKVKEEPGVRKPEEEVKVVNETPVKEVTEEETEE